MPCEMTSNFAYWDEYWGELYRDNDETYPSIIYGFENVSTNVGRNQFVLPSIGACYGYICQGAINVANKLLREGEYFCLGAGGTLYFDSDIPTRVVVSQRIGFRGVNMFGGPIEPKGRLKYIDTCSDTLLIGPWKKGDPCLNHLHFPEGIDQTSHVHPTTRSGIVARGKGACITPDGEYPLFKGRLFWIPPDGDHRFQTLQGSTMDVVPYHPDTDFGPEDETHPMVNMTWVDGGKIDNTTGRHAQAEVMNTEIKVD